MAVSLVEVAQATLAIVDAGAYQARSWRRHDLRAAIDRAVQGTRLYTPEEGAALLARPAGTGRAPATEVSAETTGAAARRLVQREGIARVLALNFASALEPGGGFLRGARAQEEDLARSSALYHCLRGQRAYYDVNRAYPRLYTDHMLHSPAVPFFRDDDLALLDEPFLCSILTVPAPCLLELTGRDDSLETVSRTLHARAGKLLAVAEAAGERTLVLGAWGCGAFRNDPVVVAGVFADWLGSPRFAGSFDRVTFAVYDRAPGQPNLAAFRARF
jgi:uncharacterized protein (TIGR02452 family)